MLQLENPSLNIQKLAKYIFHIFRARTEQDAPNAGHDTINIVTHSPGIRI